MPGTRCAAHRGGAGLWPENSLRAVRESVRLGSPLVEVDVHLAADGTPAVIHDAVLDRTTDRRGRIAELTRPALTAARLTAPDGSITDEWLPALDDVLKVLRPSRADLLLELKGPSAGLRYERTNGGVRALPAARYEGLEETVLTALHAHDMAARTTVLAFNPDVLVVMRKLRSEQPLMLLVSEQRVRRTGAGVEEPVDWALAAGATAIGLEHSLVDARVVEAARRAGLAVNVWTVDDPAAIRRFADLGVDIVTTDRPDLALRVLGAG